MTHKPPKLDDPTLRYIIKRLNELLARKGTDGKTQPTGYYQLLSNARKDAYEKVKEIINGLLKNK